MRTVTVRATWEFVGRYEVADDVAPFDPADLDRFESETGEYLDAHDAELIDWEVEDPAA